MSKKEKLKYLHEIDINLKLLKLFVRLSYKYNILVKKIMKYGLIKLPIIVIY